MTGTVDSTDLADRWIAAWTYARGLSVSRVAGWPLVHVGSPTRETELICVAPSADALVPSMSHIVGDPRAMLTVLADDIAPYRSLALPPGVRVDRDDETLMVGRLSPTPVPAIDPRFSIRWEEIGRQSKYVVEHDERVVAEGYVGVLGADAVYDAVETTPAYQRQGLGRHVIAALAGRAVERGATSGILAATAAGRLLYESLGWRPAAAMWSLMGAPVDG